MKYKISVHDAQTHFLALEYIIDYVHQDTIYLQLPAWRPGRYEMQNYAKNIRCFDIVNEVGENIPYKKITKDKWQVDTRKASKIVVRYQYYANQYDAGASYVCGDFIYVNPVNCLMYVEGRMDEAYILELQAPSDYQIACQLPCDGHIITAKNFDNLADSPFIASASMHHYSFEVNCLANSNNQKSTIHFWFQGTPYTNMQQLIDETIAYTNEQITLFGELPCSHFHFLYHILPNPFRHGVEHADSTVISMGPNTDWLKSEFYDSFMAISSHELFHLWNVKRIRPSDMLPYDFTKENYSTLGYVYEGVTTYYGDIILLRSGVWNWQQYNDSFNGDLLKHYSNDGSRNYSVAESSFDTWLDGYVPGVPARKTSIYIEGMLAAFVADILIIFHSKGKYSLDNIMKDLYTHFAKNGKGYTEIDYCALLEKYAGISFEEYFTQLIWGKGHYQYWLEKVAVYIGCNIDYDGATLERLPNPTQHQNLIFDAWVKSRFVVNQ